MVHIQDTPSRTFGEFLLLPNLTRRDCVPENVDLRTPVVRYRPTGPLPSPERSPLTIKIPIARALMQAVSSEQLAIALARRGGLSFIHGAQAISDQAEMVRRVKNHKAGFVVSDSNLDPNSTLADVLILTKRTGHSTIAVTGDGGPHGELLGIITRRDYRPGTTALDTRVREFMTPFEKLIFAKLGVDLGDANDLIWKHKLNCLPIVDDAMRLRHIVFRKDYDEHRDYPAESVDSGKRLIVGGGINSQYYRDRVPALLDAGVDVMCIDSSDGFSEWQADTIAWIKSTYGDRAYVGAGNVVDREGFLYLAKAGADFVKVGIGGGSICITREQKGIGRGQASAVIDAARAREEYLHETGVYVPLCSDGGTGQDYHSTLALAMGADFVMMGRYFARFEEAPGMKVLFNGQFVKEYWGEGSNRARNWERYAHHAAEDNKKPLLFEEGVDSYVPYAGALHDNLRTTLAKVKSTMCSCGAISIAELSRTARPTLASSVSLREGGVHDVMLREVEAVRY